MAVGDLVSDIVVSPAGGSATFQPSAGTEILIFGYALSETGNTGSFKIMFYDGTYSVILMQDNTAIEQGTSVKKIAITNSNYLWFTNAGGGNIDNMYSGVITKES